MLFCVSIFINLFVYYNLHFYMKYFAFLVAVIFILTAMPFETRASGLYFEQLDSSQVAGSDLDTNFTAEQRLRCEDFVGLIEEIVFKITSEYSPQGNIYYKAVIFGASGDSFYTESDIFEGEVGVTKDYVFNFPAVDVQNTVGLCENNKDFFIGVKKDSGSYVAGKVWGTLSGTAYRDSWYNANNAGYLEDLYFIINPGNLALPISFTQPDNSEISGLDLKTVGYASQRLSCDDFEGVVKKIQFQISTSYNKRGAITYQAMIKGLANDTFFATSSVVTGIRNTNQNYIFDFGSIDLTNTIGICDTSNEFMIGVKMHSGGYITGKVWGTLNHSAYRDTWFSAINAGQLSDLYFSFIP